MVKKVVVLILTVCFLCFFQNRGFDVQSDVKIETGVSLEWLYGYTQYQIGGNFSYSSTSVRIFPLSELVFPINVAVTSLDLGISFLDRYSVKASIKHNNLFGAHKANSYTGKMEDSDWGYWFMKEDGATWASPDSLDIYSESDAYLTAIIFDFCFDYTVVKKKIFFLDIGLGMLYQKFDYTIKDLDQWYPSYVYYSDQLDILYPYISYYSHQYASGTVITYRIEYIIPYLTLSPGVNYKEKLYVRFSVGLSPCAGALDRDDHVMRMKLCTGKSIGVSVRSTIKIDYRVHQHVSVGLFFNCIYTHTWGTQEQVQYGYDGESTPGVIGSINSVVSSLQISAGIAVQFIF